MWEINELKGVSKMKNSLVRKVVSLLLAAMVVVMAIPATQVGAYPTEEYLVAIAPGDIRPTRPGGGVGGQ